MDAYNESYRELFSLTESLHSKLNLVGPDDESPTEPDDFVYEPLGQGSHTRVLYILDSASDYDLIQCLLVPVRLDPGHMPVYTTISYSGGGAFADTSNLDHAILCNGRMLQVTENVHEVLRRLRSLRTGHRARPEASDYYDVLYRHGKMARGDVFNTFVWIDSICIDQRNNAEKSAQVMRMAEIYANPASTVIWLGEYSEKAIAWARNLWQEIESLPARRGGILAALQNRDPYNRLTTLLQTSSEAFDAEIFQLDEDKKKDLSELFQSGTCEESKATHKIAVEYKRTLNDARETITTKLSMNVTASTAAQGYRQLVSRTWFTRKWVVQEVTLTAGKDRTILLGGTQINFRILQNELQRYGLTEAAVFLEGTEEARSLNQNLHVYASAECSRAHDHIYSLMGISQDSGWLFVDYELDAAVIYCAVAKHYIMSGNGLAVLTLATAKRAGPDLPSWVPDWRSRWQQDRSNKHADAMTTLSSIK